MTENIHETILNHLYFAGTQGMTYKELLEPTGKEHGTISGALSLLHKDGKAFYLEQTRKNCHIYVHASFRKNFDPKDRVDFPRRTMTEQYLRLLEEIVTAYRFGAGLEEAIEQAEKYV